MNDATQSTVMPQYILLSVCPSVTFMCVFHTDWNAIDDDDDDGVTVTGAGPEAGAENDSSYESSYSLMSESDDVSCDNIVSADMVSTVNHRRVTSHQCTSFVCYEHRTQGRFKTLQRKYYREKITNVCLNSLKI